MSDSQSVQYPLTNVDFRLKELGYDIPDECAKAVEAAGLNSPILDVATGNGRMAFTLASHGHTVVTSDYDEEVLARAIGRLGRLFPGRLSFTLLDAQSMELPDGCFQGVVSANALHELNDPARAVSEMIRVCGAGGTLMLLDFNDTGFEVIAKVRRELFNTQHPRGVADYEGLSDVLASRFRKVEKLHFGMNDVWIGREKRD